MKMDSPNAANPVPRRPKLTMSTAYPHEHSHAPSACPVEPHYPMQEQQYKDHSPTSSYPPRSEAFHHETFDIDPAQVQYNSHPLYQRPGIQDLDGAESVFDGPSVQGGSRMMPVQNGLNQRLSMDGQPRNGDMASMGPATPMSPQAAAALESLVACGGVEGLFKRFSLSQATRGTAMNPTPHESPRDSFQSLASPTTHGAYPNVPSPPSSIAAGSVCSKTSSVKGGSSPRLEATMPATSTAYAYSPSVPKSPLPSPQQTQPNGRFSDRQAPNVRSARSSSKPQDAEMDIFERAWGKLFDEKGYATERMGLVLRGIANHIAGLHSNECAVLTPSNMAEFYMDHRLSEERHPYRDVFRCEEGNKDHYESLGRLFDEIECDYLLVKPTKESRPVMPALTPTGFVQWFVTAIWAYPDEESRRLNSICKAGIAIHSPEGKTRLPAMLPRRLLPQRAEVNAKEIFEKAIRDHLAAKGRKPRVVVTQHRPPSPPHHSSHGPRRQSSARGDPHGRTSDPNIHRTRDREPVRNDRDDDEDRRRKSVSFNKKYEKGSSRIEVPMPRHNSEGGGASRGRTSKSSQPGDQAASSKHATKERSQSRRRSSMAFVGEVLRDLNYTLSPPSAKQTSSSSSSHDEPGRGGGRDNKKDRHRGRGEDDFDYDGQYSYGAGDFTPRQGAEPEVDKSSSTRRRRRRSGSQGVSIVDQRRSSRNLGGGEYEDE